MAWQASSDSLRGFLYELPSGMVGLAMIPGSHSLGSSAYSTARWISKASLARTASANGPSRWAMLFA